MASFFGFFGLCSHQTNSLQIYFVSFKWMFIHKKWVDLQVINTFIPSGIWICFPLFWRIFLLRPFPSCCGSWGQPSWNSLWTCSVEPPAFFCTDNPISFFAPFFLSDWTERGYTTKKTNRHTVYQQYSNQLNCTCFLLILYLLEEIFAYTLSEKSRQFQK